MHENDGAESESFEQYSGDGAAAPTPEEIAVVAYAIWLERGAGDGSAEQDWLEAERRLCAARSREGVAQR